MLSRRYLLFFFAPLSVYAQQKPPREQEPPEEDESAKPKEYAFNPLQAAKEVKVGDFYLRKKSYKAASRRYLEATRWDPSLADAFLKLGEVREKLNDADGAKEAYAKYIELAPDTKTAAALKKRYKL